MKSVLDRLRYDATGQSSSVTASVHSKRTSSILPFSFSWPFRSATDSGHIPTSLEHPMGKNVDANDASSQPDKDDVKSRRKRTPILVNVRPPLILGDSSILGPNCRSELHKIVENLPVRFVSHDWELVYTTMRDGTSLQTLYTKVQGVYPNVIIVRDSHGHIFGCFTPTAWKMCTRYEGTGESFVFTLIPDVAIHKWSRKNSYFQLASATSLALGGGGSFALFVDSMVERGSSGHCATFDSPCLASAEQFNIVVLEAFRIVPPHS